MPRPLPTCFLRGCLFAVALAGIPLGLDAERTARAVERAVQDGGSFASALITPVHVARTAPRPAIAAQAGLYKEIAAAPRTDVPRFARPLPGSEAWMTKPFATLVSELSPAVLYQTALPEITFFSGIEAWGHGGPTHVAIRTPAGIQFIGRGGSLPAARQAEPWLLAWFAGAEGWQFDVPWLIVLQHRARTIELTGSGLRIRFETAGGRIVAMPFYGYYKAPPAGTRWSRVLDGAIDMGIETWTWAAGLPDGVADRARWWSQVLRRYPIRCNETFRIDRSNDVLTIRSTFEFLDIADDWGTPPRTLAPLAPTLALALIDDHNTFPMRFSAAVVDPFVMTPHGPYMGVEGQDSYDVEFETLRYIHETERDERPPAGSPSLAIEADNRLQETAGIRWREGGRIEVDHGPQNFVWAAMGDRFYPMALPYIRDAAVAARARRALREYFRGWVLQDARFTSYDGPVAAWRGRYLLKGPGIDSWGALGDAGKFSENLFSALWAYAHYTGDVDAIRARWDLIRRLDITPLESGWKGVGRGGIAELGDEAAPPIDYARLAWMVGDINTYYFQSYIATRELLVQFVKQRGAAYFRRLQPYHQFFAGDRPSRALEAIPPDAFISTLHGGTEGWQIDGPTFPREHGERQYQNRWVRFSHGSVARFYRDHLGAADLRVELDAWRARFANLPEPGRRSQWLRDDPHIMPSLARLLSLTLDGPLSEIEALAVHDGRRLPFAEWRLDPASSVFASALAIIRLSHPRQHDRLVPRSGQAGPFVLGLERSIPSQWSVLVQQLETWHGEQLSWPVVGWTNWVTPRQPSDRPGSRLFSFGAVAPTPTTPPRTASEWTQLNWNTYVVWYDD